MKRKLFALLAVLAVTVPAWAEDITDLSTTDASNTARFPENMAPSAVNDGARALEGIIARWYEDWRGSVVDYGPADAMRVTPNRTLSAYEDGLFMAFEATAANTGAATFEIGTLGAKSVKKAHDQNLAAGDIEAGQKVIVVYNADEDVFQMLSVPATNLSDPLTTRGDIIYRDSSSTTRLALGVTDAILTSDGTDLAWSVTPSPIGAQTAWIPAGAMVPTVTGGAAELSTSETTSGNPDLSTLDFDQSSDEAAQFSVSFPKGWNESTVTFVPYWTTAVAVTAGQGVGVALQCVSVSDDGSADASYGSAVVVQDDGGSAEDVMVGSESSAVTCAGSPAEGDLTFFRVFRDVSDANDDMTTDMQLIGLKLLYTLDAGNDD